MVDHGILEIRFRVLVLQRVFEKSRFCHISPTMFPHSSFQTAGANPSPRTVSLDLPGLFKHPLRESPLIASKKVLISFCSNTGVATLSLSRRGRLRLGAGLLSD